MKGVFLVIIFVGFISCYGPKEFKVTKSNSIYDSVGLLTNQQTDSIFHLIHDLNSKVGSQMVVIIIDSLNGQEINNYANREFNRLKIGREKYDDGILFVMALRNRQMRIEVGYGLELIIKDEIASRINRNIVAPDFRLGEYGRGVYKGLDSIKYLIEKNRYLIGKKPGYYKYK